jgi:hypothetical protein
MGLILVATALLVFGLRFYVMASGGFPNETVETAEHAQHDDGAAVATKTGAGRAPPSPGSAEGVCVVLSPGASPRARGRGSK